MCLWIDTIFETFTNYLFKISPFINCDKATHDSRGTLFYLLEASTLIHRGNIQSPLFFRRGLAHTYISSICFILIIVISIIPGGLLCCLSTLPHLSEGLSSDSMFNLALVGQALTGIACPFISCVPTKISQHWFNDEQRALATILLGKNKLIIAIGLWLFTKLTLFAISS